jgi:hypothetical protein
MLYTQLLLAEITTWKASFRFLSYTKMKHIHYFHVCRAYA